MIELRAIVTIVLYPSSWFILQVQRLGDACDGDQAATKWSLLPPEAVQESTLAWKEMLSPLHILCGSFEST